MSTSKLNMSNKTIWWAVVALIGFLLTMFFIATAAAQTAQSNNDLLDILQHLRDGGVLSDEQVNMIMIAATAIANNVLALGSWRIPFLGSVSDKAKRYLYVGVAVGLLFWFAGSGLIKFWHIIVGWIMGAINYNMLLKPYGFKTKTRELPAATKKAA